MTSQDLKVWNHVLEQVGNSVSAQQFSTWFQELELSQLTQDQVTISVPSQFHQDWINSNYYSVLQDAFQSCTGSRPKIHFAFPQTRSNTKSIQNSTLAPPRVQSRLISEIQLNDHYTFDNFVVGPSNSLSHAASVAVAESPSLTYNPLFLHSAVGLGKTHLMQAICCHILKEEPQKTIYYLSCEDFVNEFITSVERGELESFRYKFRHVDVLLIDDIHFLAGKERTQEEFFHTFNTLYHAKKQIILCSDSPPKEIPTLEDRLVSRFKWGLVTKIESPHFETRVAILRRKAKIRKLDVPLDVLHFVAEHIDTNVRELEGAINILAAYAAAKSQTIDIILARQCLKDQIKVSPVQVSIDTILELIVEHFGIRLSELQSKKRSRSITFPRQICMYLIKRLTNYSLEEIGGYFGGRDHSTVIYAIEQIKKKKSADPEFSEYLEKLVRTLKPS